MKTVTVREAKKNLCRLMADAEAGEEVVIARGRVAAVRLVPVTRPRRTPGAMTGRFVVGPEFFEPLRNQELDAWSGSRE